jgi:hypothetical protein
VVNNEDWTMTFPQTNKGNTVCGCAEARNRCGFLCLIERGGVDFPGRQRKTAEIAQSVS